MPYGIGAGGLLGMAVETVSGTYTAPTKYCPITNETLHIMEDTQFLRTLRGDSADPNHATPGNEHAEGDVEMYAYEDCVLYWLVASRSTIVKTGTPPNHIYTFTPSAAAIPVKTLSLTIKRSDQIFGYTGCTVGAFKFGVDNGILTFGVSVIARNEASQSSPSPTWPTTAPFGAGMYSIEIPTSTPVAETDSFEWSVEDNAEPQHRLKSTGRGAEFVKFGERDVTITLARDFLTRTDYDNFKAVVSQSITMTATKGANNSISLVTPNTFKETYEVGLSGQGDLNRAQISYRGVLDSGTPAKAYSIVLKTQEDYVP